MVASNALSIAQAYFDRHLWFRAIYVEDEPAGFLMLYDDPEKPEYFLWRLMIAGPYQRSGVGGRTIQLLADHVKERPGARELLVSCGEGEGSPEAFYLKQGFQRNGKKYGDEIGLVMSLD
jgi:diamine N-acetyltransferase